LDTSTRATAAATTAYLKFTSQLIMAARANMTLTRLVGAIRTSNSKPRSWPCGATGECSEE
jgi:hypothetical protein